MSLIHGTKVFLVGGTYKGSTGTVDRPTTCKVWVVLDETRQRVCVNQSSVTTDEPPRSTLRSVSPTFRFSKGASVRFVAGTYVGHTGTVDRPTLCKVWVFLDGTGRCVCVNKTSVAVTSTASSDSRESNNESRSSCVRNGPGFPPRLPANGDSCNQTFRSPGIRAVARPRPSSRQNVDIHTVTRRRFDAPGVGESRRRLESTESPRSQDLGEVRFGFGSSAPRFHTLSRARPAENEESHSHSQVPSSPSRHGESRFRPAAYRHNNISRRTCPPSRASLPAVAPRSVTPEPPPRRPTLSGAGGISSSGIPLGRNHGPTTVVEDSSEPIPDDSSRPPSRTFVPPISPRWSEPRPPRRPTVSSDTVATPSTPSPSAIPLEGRTTVIEDSLEPGEACVVCMVEVPDVVFVHGETTHVICCRRCSQALCARGYPCPVCRSPIECVIRYRAFTILISSL